MPTVPLRADNAYIGVGIQTAQGTAVAPTIFPRIMDGSELTWDAKFEDVWEMDGSRRLSTIIRNLNSVKVKLVWTPRPIELGFFAKAAMGNGGDTITLASTPSTTLTNSPTGGTSTTCTVASATGLSGSGNVQLLVSQGTANVELVTFALPIATLTLTVAATYNGGKFKNNHTSGDTIAAPSSVNTSVTTASIVGATTLLVGNNNGLASFPITLCVSQGLAAEEFVTFSGISGAGPYTRTVAATYNGGAMLNAHAIGDTVMSGAVHVLTDQIDGNYYSVEIGIGALNSQGGIVLRARDCKVETAKRSSKAGSLLIYELELTGLSITVQGSPSTVVLEAHLPFLYTQGVWTLDGSVAGDALTLEMFDITQKNNLDLVQTEQVVGAAIIFGRVQVDETIQIVYQAGTQYLQKVYTGTAAGTTDAQTLFIGSLSVTFSSADGLATVKYVMNAVVYTKAQTPVPKADGKHYAMQIQGSSISNQAVQTYVLQETVTNTQGAPY